MAVADGSVGPPLFARGLSKADIDVKDACF